MDYIATQHFRSEPSKFQAKPENWKTIPQNEYLSNRYSNLYQIKWHIKESYQTGNPSKNWTVRVKSGQLRTCRCYKHLPYEFLQKHNKLDHYLLSVQQAANPEQILELSRVVALKLMDKIAGLQMEHKDTKDAIQNINENMAHLRKELDEIKAQLVILKRNEESIWKHFAYIFASLNFNVFTRSFRH
ncbi:hypothetical protein XELAEV_18016159mg [Xenopus laevis]|uniref:Uncharacterized protein n=1 Tax=Xenopus laevis TaxID=8355 RepID=A0A974HWL3_XENLA|nr:hypothetical protein XELAEV_18016159mg [Xenopus laevis]